MDLKFIFVGLLFLCLRYHSINCKIERITYFSTERPVVEWYDTKIIKNFTVLSRRVSRQDPRHYVELYIHSLIDITNHVKMDFYFYQFLTNRYRPSFVEMHFSFCDMLHSDPFFGQTIRNALKGRECPFSPGEYYMKNLSIPFVPKSFPFTKGRIYCNISLSRGDASNVVARGSIDIEIKVAKINKN